MKLTLLAGESSRRKRTYEECVVYCYLTLLHV